MVYSKKGPFVNSSAPGIDQAFLNGLENYLNAGAANCSVPICSKFSGSGTGSAQVVTHNMKDQNNVSITPDTVIVQYAGNFGGPPANPAYYYGQNSTQVTVVAQNGFSWVAIALKF